MSVAYTTLAQAKTQLNTDATSDDVELIAFIRQVSRRVDSYFKVRRPLFAPVHETRSFPFTRTRISSANNSFALAQPLLSFSAVSATGNTVPLSTISGWGFGVPLPPFNALRLNSFTSNWYDYYQDDVTPEISVTGVWGYHRDYANAYVARDTLQGALNSSATTFTVADADGADEYGLTPRFSIGNILRINSELMDVTGVNTDTNTLTVRRGVLGTTAVAHDSADSVEVFIVDESISYAVARQVGLIYARRGAYDVLQTDGIVSTQFPSDLTAVFKNIMQEFAYT